MIDMSLEMVYGASLLTIIYFCVLAVVRKDIWIGKSGALLLGGMAMAAVKLFEYPPRHALVTLVACMAALCILAYWRWRNYMKLQEQLAAMRRRRKTDAPL
jgi:ABC-type uncharacterized transport system permease subunit